ncbi:MAG: hypothetical protein AABY13_01370, partial [Nanoarchaeota archaeon]
MFLRKGQLSLLLFNIVYIILFSVYFVYKRNYEFVVYMSTIVFFLFIVMSTNHKLFVPKGAWWALTALAFSHLLGGMVYVGTTRLYDLMLVPLSTVYPVLRYDQLVHAFGFVCVTLFLYFMTRSWRGGMLRGRTIVLFLSALFLIAVGHETYEEIISILIPATGIGDFTDTAIDLVFDMAGGSLALGALWLAERSKKG